MNTEDEKLTINHSEIETKWQSQWKENKVFEPKINDKPKYFGNVAYPYANSVMHIGHGRTYSIADIFLRYQRVLGKNVLQPLGFHISGTPVLAVSDGIKRGDEKILKQVTEAISDYVNSESESSELIETFKDPKNIANFFSNTIEGSLESIGIAIDWSRQFTTGEPMYNKFIEWQFSKLKNAGLLVQGKYPILYSVDDENAVGEDDIKDGDVDKVSVSNMVGIKFAVCGEENAFVICATLRCDALFCVQNLWIKESMKVARLSVGVEINNKVVNEIWYVACDAINKVKYQFDNVKVLDENLLGSYFTGKTVTAPIVNKEIPIYSAEFCDSKHGTGLVYSSPADSPHDYLNLFEIKFPGKSLNDSEFTGCEPLGLTPITETFDKKKQKISYMFDIPAYDMLMKRNIFKSAGNSEVLETAKQDLYKEAHFGSKMINSGEFDGLVLKKNIAGDRVRDVLFEKGLAVNFYETSRRATTRGNDNVIVANLQGQWFLNYSSREVKDKAQELLSESNFFPANLKESEAGYIEWANMRPCARKRGLGTQIPYDRDWIVEPLSDSTIYQMLYMISGLIRDNESIVEKLSFEVLDYIYFGTGAPETFDIDKVFLSAARAQVEYWNNVDFRYVGQTHMSNHLNFLIYHYSLIFPKSMWPKTIVAGSLMMRDGEKISKSKGNGTPLFRMKNTYGSDLYRLYIGVNSNFDTEMDFKEDEILNLSKKFDRWTDLIGRSLECEKKDFDSYSDIDKWLISKFYKSVEVYFENFENFKIREAYVEVLYEVLNNINYHSRRAGEGSTINVLRFIAKDYLILMTPIVPHICEELYSRIKINSEEFISLKAFDTDYKEFISKEILDKEEIMFDLIRKVSAQMESSNEKVSKVSIIQAKSDKFELFDLIKNTLATDGKNPKLIFGKIAETLPQYVNFGKKFVPKCLGAGISFYLSKEEEKKLLRENLEFFKAEFGCDVEVLDADNLEDNSTASPRDFQIKVE
jgi:leucyl-tRNA synthetase